MENTRASQKTNGDAFTSTLYEVKKNMLPVLEVLEERLLLRRATAACLVSKDHEKRTPYCRQWVFEDQRTPAQPERRPLKTQEQASPCATHTTLELGVSVLNPPFPLHQLIPKARHSRPSLLQKLSGIGIFLSQSTCDRQGQPKPTTANPEPDLCRG